ncbi:MAG TPA: hypothetical protein VFV72_11225 [Candidatus Limnocylindrales bacterium]|nr:hypothetical protein [Candidatus Limnocylindrales bacterium]
MTPKRLLRNTAIAALVLVLTAPASNAATTVVVEREAGINFDAIAFGVTAACGVPIELHTVGKSVVISRYDKDGRLVAQTIQAVWDGYLLNPANGKTVMSKVAGPERIRYLEDATIVDTLTGSTHRNVPGAGLVSGFIGRDRVVLAPTGEVDEEGFPIYDFVDESQSGQWLGNGGLCEFLV